MRSIMKTKILSHIKNGVLLALVAAGVFSCTDSVGLGEAVDLTAPEITITSHSDNTTVPSEFTLCGTAYDNIEVKSITVDFASQNLHYKVVPGSSWYKMNKATGGEWVQMPASEGACTKSGDKWSWFVYVRASEGNLSGITYNLYALASDAMANSGKNSKVDLSLIMDEKNPSVSIYAPELLTGAYDAVSTEAANYKLRDGNVISKLWNGDITLQGRQDGSISFKELRIDFDNGALSAGTRKVTGDATALTSVDELAKNVSLGDTEELQPYFSKTLKVGEDGITDLRNWTLTVAQSEWVSASKNSELLSCGEAQGAGKIIRVVTTSLSDSYAWEKKVIGYFVWWPEADAPWINAYVGDDADNGDNTYGAFPSANFSGTVQDDDGIKEVYYTIEKYGTNATWSSYKAKTYLTLPDENAKSASFAITMPAEFGKYRIAMTVTDMNGKSATKTKYFKTLDVSPPTLTITTPLSASSVLADKDGKIAFSGKVTDDGTVKSLSLIYLHPVANDDPANIIRYMSGNEAEWELATTGGADSAEYSYTTDGGTVFYTNKIYSLALEGGSYNSTAKVTEYTFTRTLNLFENLGIDGISKCLSDQYFVLRAEDNSGAKTVQQLVLAGDNQSPELTVTSIQQFAGDGTSKIEEFTFGADGDVPTFNVVKSGDYAIIKGTWSDNSVSAWNNDKTKIKPLAFTWGDDTSVSITNEQLASGVWNWTAKAQNLPKNSGTLSVSLADFGGNSTTVTKSIFIETAELGLESISAIEQDGSYKEGTIQITLNFTKNTTVTGGTPTLTLNNRGTATYTGGSGSAQHIFKYTIGGSDLDTKALPGGTLDVTAFNANGALYNDASVSGSSQAFTVELPEDDSKKLGTSRSIIIDRTAPKIASFKVISSAGYYKAGKTVLFLLAFDESVAIANASNLGLSFSSIASPSVSAKESGSSVIFTYTVGEGQTASPLSLSSFANTAGVTVTDLAGNALTDWSVPAGTDLSGINIDTSAPSAPIINGAWGSAKLVTAATSFTLGGLESGATAEYSIDGGTNWQTYSNAVSLSNSGTYQIKARQTDRAGNVSSALSASITVEKGDFLNKITADTVSGTYAAGKEITGRLIFRKDITLPAGASVTLNAKNSGGTAYTSTLNKDTSGNPTISGGCDYTFTYTVQEGDYIDGGAVLDVTGWSFSTVTYDTGITSVGNNGKIDFDLSFTSASGKNLSDNRSIYVLTAVPSISNPSLGGSVASDGTVSGEYLKFSFNRAVSKVSGNIVLELSASSSDECDTYIAPAVIKASDFLESYAFASYYEEGLNGATLNSDSTLTNDTTTKYVLKYATEPTDSTLVSSFVTEGWNKVEIPVVASAVSLSADKKTVTVDLSGAYRLPVKGAKYKLTIPAGAFCDEVQNKNEAYGTGTTGVSANGVEPPVIRINKGAQVITLGPSPNYTIGSSVTMPSTATMRIDCQTPGATITYSKNEKNSTKVEVINSQKEYTTKTAGATVSSSFGEYSSSTTYTLGSEVSSYTGATGLKVAIAAKAAKRGFTSVTSYEYATRTVLRLSITGKYGTYNGDYGETSSINENGNLIFGKLKVWVVGGDYSYGTNSISPFPLSWSDSSNFKLMKSASGFTASGMVSEWYWITWDVTAPTYHGFVVGNVPSDAATDSKGAGGKGPGAWYSGEGGWDSQKANYILYPGETLIMCISSSGTYDNGQFHWATKNYKTR